MTLVGKGSRSEGDKGAVRYQDGTATQYREVDVLLGVRLSESRGWHSSAISRRAHGNVGSWWVAKAGRIVVDDGDPKSFAHIPH